MSDLSYTSARQILTDRPASASHTAAMTQARKHIVSIDHAGTYHCVSRCVRRSWLCGFDRYLQKSFEHRKAWVERRIADVAEIFACSVLSYAIMSNHFHIVLAMVPAEAKSWSDQDVAERWCRLYPRKKPLDQELKMAEIAANPERVKLYRARLHDLSWFMKLLNEPIARRANKEDGCDGKFWSQRFWCQRLLSQKAILAAMTYVDLNPVRAKIAESTSTSKHTSVRKRGKEVRGDLLAAAQPLRPILGCQSYNLPKISEGEYIDLVDYTGRQLYPGKRGVIKETEPRALDKLGLNKEHWAHKVKGFGSGFSARWFRVVGELEEMLEKAKEMGQRTLFGVGLARFLRKI